MRTQALFVLLTWFPLAGVATAQEDKKPLPADRAILGQWHAIDRHVAIGSLFQPVHGVRKREAKVHFEWKGDHLAGYAVTEDFKEISGQERWIEGRTEFKKVRFDQGKLRFEFDVGEWRKQAGPLAVESGQLPNKGVIRIEAKLDGDRLVGKWGMFLADESEVFRGEWEATRVKPPGQPAFKPGEQLPLAWEYRLNGPRAGQTGSLSCTYYYQTVVALYVRSLDEPVIELLKKVEAAVRKHGSDPWFRHRLGGYVVLLPREARQVQSLVDLGEREHVQRTTLATLTSGQDVWMDARMGEFETLVLLLAPGAKVQASYGFRKDELKRQDVDAMLATFVQRWNASRLLDSLHLVGWF